MRLTSALPSYENHVGSRLDMAARAKSFAKACSNHERDLRRHGAGRNRWKDISLRERRSIGMSYRKERRLFCQHLVSRFVGEDETGS
jgi:hypothetical protein